MGLDRGKEEKRGHRIRMGWRDEDTESLVFEPGSLYFINGLIRSSLECRRRF